MRLILLAVSIWNLLAAVVPAAHATPEVGEPGDTGAQAPTAEAAPAAPAASNQEEYEDEDNTPARNCRNETATHPCADDAHMVPMTEARARKFGQEYDVIAVVDKLHQTMTIRRFRNGKLIKKDTRTFKVSTGQEKWVCAPIKDSKGKLVGHEPHWTGTRNGYYPVCRLGADDYSHPYNNASMYKSVVFNCQMGVAVHESKDLRPHQSHGCVRTDGSETLFKYVLESGGRFDPLTSPIFRPQCPSRGLRGDALASCVEKANARSKHWQKIGQAAIDEADELGYGLYDPAPEMPEISERTGEANPYAGGPARFKYKALVVVQCVDKMGHNCGTTKIPPIPEEMKQTCFMPKKTTGPRIRLASGE